MGDGDTKAKQPALPTGAPKDLTAFLECTSAAVTIKGGTMGWIGKLDLKVAEVEPDVTFTAGENGAINISVGKSIFSVTLPASIADGQLTIDVSSLPDTAGDFVKGWVADLNGWLKSKGKQFGAAKLDKGAVTLTKVALAPVKPADKPVKASADPAPVLDPSPLLLMTPISSAAPIGDAPPLALNPVAPTVTPPAPPPSASAQLVDRANQLDADIRAGRAGDQAAALAQLDGLIAEFDAVLDRSRAQDLASFIQLGASSHFDLFEQKLQMLANRRDQIASSGLPFDPDVRTVLDSVDATRPPEYGWNARRAGSRGVAVVVGAAGVLLVGGALLIGSGALGSKTPAASTTPADVAGSASHAVATSTPVESVPASAAEAITDNELVDNVGTPCTAPTTLHMKWVLKNVAAGTAIVVEMSGPGLPSQASFTVGGDGSIVASYTVPAGAAVWTTDLTTIGGEPAPDSNATNKSTVSCSGP